MSSGMQKLRELISGNNSFMRLLQHELGEESVPMKPGKKNAIMAIAKGDTGREHLKNHPNARVRQLMQARIALRSWPLHIKRVGRIMAQAKACLLYTSPSPRDGLLSRMPSSA